MKAWTLEFAPYGLYGYVLASAGPGAEGAVLSAWRCQRGTGRPMLANTEICEHVADAIDHLQYRMRRG